MRIFDTYLVKFYSLVLFLIGLQLYGQSTYGIGQWQYHFPFHNGEYVINTGNRIYLGSEISMFYYDQEDMSKNPFSKIDGLSDFSISATAYDQSKNQMYIAYANGNLDVVSETTINNVNEIVRDQNIAGSKKISHVFLDNDFAYLSTPFGVVVYNSERDEIKETYRNIGTGGNEISAQQTIILPQKDSIYILCNEGILVASVNSNNLLDNANWTLQTIENNVPATDSIISIEGFNDELYLSLLDSSVCRLEAGKWERLDIPAINSPINKLKNLGNELAIIEDERINYIDVGGNISNQEFLGFNIQDIDKETNKIWLADANKGLIEYTTSSNWNSIYPNGPLTNRVVNFGNYNGQFFILPGQMTDASAPGYYYYNELTWYGPTINYFGLYGIGDMAYQASTGKLFFASAWGGLIEYNSNDGQSKLYNDTTTIWSNGVVIPNPIPRYYPSSRAYAVETDLNDNVWYVTYGVISENNLFRLGADGSFTAFTLDEDAMQRARELEIDNQGNIWIRCDKGIVAFNPESGIVRYLNGSNFFKELPTAIDIDKNGDLWVGTLKGVEVCYDPYRLFSDEFYEPSIPVIGDQQLLGEESINCIYVDGGNRKWFGSSNGAWLVSEDGSEELENFNEKNSPLPSSVVNRIGINETSGEVFFALNQGAVSYWGDATVAEPEHEESIDIFPNPVEPGYVGDIGITGLASDAIVKITDVSGHLVRQIYANGGMGIWDGKDSQGNRVKTGVYMVFSAEPTGADTFVGKIIMIE